MMRSADKGRFFATLGLAVALLGTDADPVAAEDEADSTRSVQFDHLVVYEKSGRLTVDYTVESDTWEALDEDKITVWFQLDVPTRSRYPNHVISYTEEAPDRSGTVRFPDWLDTSGASRVELCLLGTGPNDSLGFGRGWICADELEFELGESSSRGPPQPRSIKLVYQKRPKFAPYAPWSTPTPRNMPTPY